MSLVQEIKPLLYKRDCNLSFHCLIEGNKKIYDVFFKIQKGHYFDITFNPEYLEFFSKEKTILIINEINKKLNYKKKETKKYIKFYIKKNNSMFTIVFLKRKKLIHLNNKRSKLRNKL